MSTKLFLLYAPVGLLTLAAHRWIRINTEWANVFLGTMLLSFYFFFELVWKRRNLPPGPTPWLIGGNMVAFLLDDFESVMSRWRREFGRIFTVWIGPIPLVMVNDINTMKRYFVQNADVFSNRWRNYVTDTFMGGVNGLIQIDGEKWREQRRFSLHVLRDFGVGRSVMEEKIAGEVRNLSSYLKTQDSVDMSTPIAICVGNIINDMLFGVTFPHGSLEMHRLHHLLDTQSQLVINPIMGLYIAAPFTSKIPLINFKWKQLMHQRRQMWDFLIEQVKKHREMFNNGHRTVDDFTFAYMNEMEKRELSGDDPGYFCDWQLTMLLLDLFFAGMETTVTTLKWAFLMMIKHPEVQRKVQMEIDAVCREEVSLSDRNSLPYTQATINEIQRIANILPINLLRTVSERTQIDGFTFEEGTMVIPQIATLLNDENVFENPKEFNPSRFMDPSGRLRRYEEFIPFSIGKRQCLGESLARAELFLIFSNVLQQFDISPTNGECYSDKRILGLTVSPPNYTVNINVRKVDSNMNQL